MGKYERRFSHNCLADWIKAIANVRQISIRHRMFLSKISSAQMNVIIGLITMAYFKGYQDARLDHNEDGEK